ncbi:DUF7507 domain-containing protein [Methanococcoides methylutens]|uniref:DUF7507 domain-containing protein n=1 Tax=Methanococcoides methylutens TaxID=2226 RepID=UPI004043A050
MRNKQSIITCFGISLILLIMSAGTVAANGEASIDIEKFTNGGNADTAPGPYIAVGDPVVWEYIVINTGSVPLFNIQVSDDQGVTVTATSPVIGLQPGDSARYTATGTAVAGQYANTGTVTADYEGGTVTDSDSSHYFGAAPAIDIEKSTNGQDADLPEDAPEILVGEDVTWTYVVTNTGNVDLTNVAVADDMIGDPIYNVGNLAVGSSVAFDVIAIGDASLGLYTNVGTVTGEYNGEIVTDSDVSHYFGVQSVDIDIKPGSFPNSINLKSNGVIPVAILSTDSFDASTVDPASVMFAGAAPLRWATEDVDKDGDLDLVFHFKVKDTGLAPGDTEAILTGETFDGISIEGTDSVNPLHGD